MNHYASVTRLYTGAETVAQNRIDEILSEAPFNPQIGEVPKVLIVKNPAAQETVQIYNEPNPAGGQPRIIYGTMETTVKAVGPLNVNGVATELNVFRATVLVSYNFRGQNYKVQLNALRASDL